MQRTIDVPPVEGGRVTWRPPPRAAEQTDPAFPTPAFAEAAHPAASRGPAFAWSAPRPPAAPARDRAVAWLVDVAAVLAVLALVILATSAVLSHGLHWLYRDAGGGLVPASPLAMPLLIAVPAAAAAAYCTVLPGLAGATLGMRLVGARLTRDLPGGGRTGVVRAGLRLAAWAVGAVALLLGPLSIVRSADGRGWHDRLTGTVVARRAPGQAAAGEVPEAA